MSDTKLYIGNLASRTDARDLKDAFSKFGRIVTVEMKRRYAFVDFAHKSDAETAIAEMDGKDFDGSKLIVEWTRGQARSGRASRGGLRRYPERSDYRIAVSNLPDRCHWSELKDHFRKAGEVVFGDVWGTKGVIEFRLKVDMEYALRELNGVKWKGYALELKKDTSRRRSYSRSPSRERYRSSRRSHRSRSPRSRSPRSRSPRSRSPRSRSRSPGRSGGRTTERSPSHSRSPHGSNNNNNKRSRSPSRSGSRDKARQDQREEKEKENNQRSPVDEKKEENEGEREDKDREDRKDRGSDRERDRRKRDRDEEREEKDDREKENEKDREEEDRERERDPVDKEKDEKDDDSERKKRARTDD